eukprot:g7679.t1
MNLLLFWYSEITQEEVKGSKQYFIELNPNDHRFTHIFEVLNLSGFVDQVVKMGIVNGNTGLGEIEWVSYPRNDLLVTKLENGSIRYPLCLHVTSQSQEQPVKQPMVLSPHRRGRGSPKSSRSSSPKLHHSTSPRQRSPSTGFGALNNENPNYSGEERTLDDVAVEFDKKQLLSSRAEGREDDDDSYLPFVIENAKTLVCKRVGPFYGRKEPGFDLESFVNSKAEADGEPPSKRLKNSGSNPFPKYSGDKKLVHFIQRLRIKLKFTPEQLYDGHEMPLTRKTFFQRGGGVLQTQEAPPQKPMNSPGSGTPGPASPNGPGAVFMPPLSPLMKNSQVKQRTEGLNYVFYKGAHLPTLPEDVSPLEDPTRSRLFYIEDPCNEDPSDLSGPSNLVSSEQSGNSGDDSTKKNKTASGAAPLPLPLSLPLSRNVIPTNETAPPTSDTASVRVVIPSTPELNAKLGMGAPPAPTPILLRPPPLGSGIGKPTPKTEPLGGAPGSPAGSRRSSPAGRSRKDSFGKLKNKAPRWDIHPNVDVILCCPRPKQLEKIFSTLATFGVRRIFLIGGAEKVEPSYFSNTKKMAPETIERALLEGLSQSAYYTRLPIVRILPKLLLAELLQEGLQIESKVSPKPEKKHKGGPELPPDTRGRSESKEAALASIEPSKDGEVFMTDKDLCSTTVFANRAKISDATYNYATLNLVAHPSPQSRKLSDIICDDSYTAFRGAFMGKRAYNKVTLCIGPEGGWTNPEIENELAKFEKVSMGPRIYKTYDAAVCMLSLLYEELGI